jgi:hypothetical protein
LCIAVAATAAEARIRAALFLIRRVSRISLQRPSSAVAAASLAVALASLTARLFALLSARPGLFAGFVPGGFGGDGFRLTSALAVLPEEKSACACASGLGTDLLSRRAGSVISGGGGGGGGEGGGAAAVVARLCGRFVGCSCSSSPAVGPRGRAPLQWPRSGSIGMRRGPLPAPRRSPRSLRNSARSRQIFVRIVQPASLRPRSLPAGMPLPRPRAMPYLIGARRRGCATVSSTPRGCSPPPRCSPLLSAPGL